MNISTNLQDNMFISTEHIKLITHLEIKRGEIRDSGQESNKQETKGQMKVNGAYGTKRTENEKEYNINMCNIGCEFGSQAEFIRCQSLANSKFSNCTTLSRIQTSLLQKLKNFTYLYASSMTTIISIPTKLPKQNNKIKVRDNTLNIKSSVTPSLRITGKKGQESGE